MLPSQSPISGQLYLHGVGFALSLVEAFVDLRERAAPELPDDLEAECC